MLTGLWTIGIKVPDLERELEFHRQIGNEIVLDETLELDGEFFPRAVGQDGRQISAPG